MPRAVRRPYHRGQHAHPRGDPHRPALLSMVEVEPLPPPEVKTVRDLILWQYAKIISKAEEAEKTRHASVKLRFEKLRSGEIVWRDSIRSFLLERERPDTCIYCGAGSNLSHGHLIEPRRGGPDTPGNVVTACRTCMASKGDSGVYEWYTAHRRERVPPAAEGKYLSLLYELHEQGGRLDIDRFDLEPLCGHCQVGYLCEETELTVYCLEGALMRRR